MKLKFLRENVLRFNNNHKSKKFKISNKSLMLISNKILKKKIQIILMKNLMIGIDQVHIKLIFKNKKKKQKINVNKFNKKLTKFFWINKLKRKRKFNNMILMLRRLMLKQNKIYQLR